MTQMRQDGAAPAAEVSAREAEVLAAVADHLTNAEIAGRLFISVRTVESHVSSMLRKLDVPDRRALVVLAPQLLAGAAVEPDRATAAAGRNGARTALTSFIGREQERADLAAALAVNRVVTAVGPGGVGKTRLAQAVAADLDPVHADGAWFVDLVPVTDPSMVAAAVSDALGLGEQRSRAPIDTVLGWLTERQVFLVLDNCEHVVDGVVAFVERLLARCPRVTVLATSRARLLVPYEWVFAVPGLSVAAAADGAAGGDAVDLFTARATAAGRPPGPADRARVAAVCRGLDGMSLAIELAAARFPSLGLDGLEQGLADRLDLLVSGRRIDDRHRSLRTTLDWSWALLEEPDRALLRRVSVFVRPFTPADAAAVSSEWAPLAPAELTIRLAGLADNSLLVAVPTDAGTRYRALETIRQYASERLAETGQRDTVRRQHADWCLRAGRELLAAADPERPAWRARFELMADELRAAVTWASGTAGRGAEAYRLGVCLAELAFVRGLPGESQRRYEQAAASATGLDAARALRLAAGAAETRHFGNEALRLHRAAAGAALAGGDRAFAGAELGRAAELVRRATGLIRDVPLDDEMLTWLADAAALAAGDPVAEAQVAIARSLLDPEGGDPAATEESGHRALALARHAGSVLLESAARDQLMSVALMRGDLPAAVAQTRQRIDRLITEPIRADGGLELSDGLNMATDVSVAIGDLTAARNFAERVRRLPFHREEPHLAVARLLVVTSLTGDWDETVALAQQYRDGWERAGRPHDGDLNRGAYAAATVFGLRGDDEARRTWLEIVGELLTDERAGRDRRCYETFDALLALHRDDPARALATLTSPPEHCPTWRDGLWRQWHAALWAEASVLCDRPDRVDRVQRARAVVGGNAVAIPLVERAQALIDGDRSALLAAGEDLARAGCHFQWARTQLLAGLADEKG
jgi:predicted ATPase/DNA-binding CsgD family transcriptional regulator